MLPAKHDRESFVGEESGNPGVHEFRQSLRPTQVDQGIERLDPRSVRFGRCRQIEELDLGTGLDQCRGPSIRALHPRARTVVRNRQNGDGRSIRRRLDAEKARLSAVHRFGLTTILHLNLRDGWMGGGYSPLR